MRESPISLTIDLNADGVRHGFFKLPISTDDSAWGAVMTPISVIANGEGPTVLLTGGNHGDEYEGITALYKLAARLTVEEVQGRVIIVPTMNALAAKAGRRCSPLDGGNLNRSFPGDPGAAPRSRSQTTLLACWCRSVTSRWTSTLAGARWISCRLPRRIVLTTSRNRWASSSVVIRRRRVSLARWLSVRLPR